jgi:hypothetical protein
MRTDVGGPSRSRLANAEYVMDSRKKYKIHIKMKPKDMTFQGEFAL